MWDAMGDTSRQPKRQRGGEDGEGGWAGNKMLHSLDARMRTQEGMLATYFLAEGDMVLVPAMVEGNKYYDDARPDKGQPHVYGPRRTSLGKAFLNKLSTIDITKSEGKEAEAIQFFDSIAAATNGPTVGQQLGLLKTLNAKLNTPQLLEGEICACMFFKTKKSPRYIFSIQFQPGSPYKHICWPVGEYANWFS